LKFREIKKFLDDNGIKQLRKGETLQDAIDFINNDIPSRKGYKYKNNKGERLSENTIIREANKESFKKSVVSPEYVEDVVKNVEDVEEDFREDKNKVGKIEHCQYCGKSLRADENSNFDIINCEECMDVAILDNCL
jgi:hypothetical protein